jgi:uncharacterized membrane protein YcaP (DUF421 family)
MMDDLVAIGYRLFGEGKDLDSLQMVSRAIVIFFMTLILLRVSGRRILGMHATFDTIISILLGGVLSRAVVGSSPFWPCIFASIAILVVYRICGWLSVRSNFFSRLIKGKTVILFEDGHEIKENMDKCMITHDDLMEGVRKDGNVASLDEVTSATMERSGQISIVKKNG